MAGAAHGSCECGRCCSACRLILNHGRILVQVVRQTVISSTHYHDEGRGGSIGIFAFRSYVPDYEDAVLFGARIIIFILFLGCCSNIPYYSVEQHQNGFDIEHTELGEFRITKHPIKVIGDSLIVPPDMEVFGTDSDIRVVHFDSKKHMNIWGPRTSIDFIILEPDTLAFSLKMDGDILEDRIVIGWADRGRYSMRFRLNERYPAGRCVFLLIVGEEVKTIRKTYLK